jgi:hypothetical protein
MLDTGREFTWITNALLAELPVRTDRPSLPVETGSHTIQLTRTAALGPDAPTSIASSAVMTDSDEAVFAKLQIETGSRIEVIIGQSYLQYFVTQLDFAHSSLRLARYTDVDHFQGDTFIGVGASFGVEAACFRVTGVTPGHDAEAKGLQVGDCVESVDQLLPSMQGPDDLLAYFRSLGPGAAVGMTIRDGTTTHVLDILVEDLLPNMSP